MGFPRLRLRTLLIAIAVLALLMAVLIPAIRNRASLDEFYSPGGVLDRRPKICAEIAAGNDALTRQEPGEAETRFRAALENIGRNVGPIPIDMSLSFYIEKSDALAGLANALAMQNRFDEAVTIYGDALTMLEDGLKVAAPEINVRDDPRVAELLERKKACEKAIEQRIRTNSLGRNR